MNKAISAIALMSLAAAGAWASDTPASVIPRGSLRSSVDRIVGAAGNRFRTPGRERLTFSPDLTVKGNAGAKVQIVLEFPGRLHLSGAGVNATRRLDAPSGKRLPDELQQLVDTLLYDSVDGFAAAQIQGGSTNFHGAGYRANGSEESFDVFTVFMPPSAEPVGRSQAKQFWFDHKTGLLMRVIAGPGIEVLYAGWRQVDGNWFPGKVTRRVNGETAIEVALPSVAVGAKQNDALFQ